MKASQQKSCGLFYGGSQSELSHLLLSYLSSKLISKLPIEVYQPATDLFLPTSNLYCNHLTPANNSM